MPAPQTVDPRGPRFAAIVTSVVLVIVLATQWWPLLAAQTLVFAIGAFVGLKPAPYPVSYRALVAPRLRPTDERDDVAPLRFAQGGGVALALQGTIGYASGFA